MISNLIGKAFWNAYDRREDAETKRHQETKAILARTAYLAHEPTSIFYVKPF